MNNLELELIDFDSTYVKFNEISNSQRKVLFDNLINLINYCNDSFALSDLKLDYLYDFDQLEQKLIQMEDKIKKLII